MAPKNKYTHVESKVKHYIANIKSQDALARQRRHLAANFQHSQPLELPGETEGQPPPPTYDQLMTKYNEALDENNFLRSVVDTCQKVDKIDINEITEISLVSESMFNSYGSTICERDFSGCQDASVGNHTPRPNVPPSRAIVLNSAVPLLQAPPKNEEKSLGVLFKKTTKKVLRKFACLKDQEKEEKRDNENMIQLGSLNDIRRVHTPRARKHFTNGIPLESTSTPGVKHRKKVQFDNNNIVEARSVQAKRLMQNLDEVHDFLATL